MRRFWLLLLLLVMPLQMSWAAVHLCIDEPAGANRAPEAMQEHGHADSGKTDDEKSGVMLADACCFAAHSCHGLHNLISQQESSLGCQPIASKPDDLQASHRLAFFAYRHERPQWLAA